MNPIAQIVLWLLDLVVIHVGDCPEVPAWSFTRPCLSSVGVEQKLKTFELFSTP